MTQKTIIASLLNRMWGLILHLVRSSGARNVNSAHHISSTLLKMEIICITAELAVKRMSNCALCRAWRVKGIVSGKQRQRVFRVSVFRVTFATRDLGSPLIIVSIVDYAALCPSILFRVFYFVEPEVDFDGSQCMSLLLVVVGMPQNWPNTTAYTLQNNVCDPQQIGCCFFHAKRAGGLLDSYKKRRSKFGFWSQCYI